MGNKVERMAICNRSNDSTKHSLQDFSDYNTSIRDDVSESTVRPSILENMDNVTLEDFTILKVLGSGAFGKVFLVEKKEKAALGQ